MCLLIAERGLWCSQTNLNILKWLLDYSLPRLKRNHTIHSPLVYFAFSETRSLGLVQSTALPKSLASTWTIYNRRDTRYDVFFSVLPHTCGCMVCLYGSVPGNVCSHGTLSQGALGVCQCWYGITTDYLGYAFAHWHHWKGPVLNECSNRLMLPMLFSVWFASYSWVSLKNIPVYILVN